MGSPHLLQRVLDRRIHALVDHLPAALEGDTSAVHQARVASRRLREALPVFGAALHRRRVRRLGTRLRRLTRALGEVRESDVLLDTLETLVTEQHAPPEVVHVVQPEIGRERSLAFEHLTQVFDAGRARRLLARLERFARHIPSPDVDSSWRSVHADRIRQRAHALLGAVADAGALFDADRLHAVRIAVKKLRYALELAGEVKIVAAGALVRQLREIQEILGQLHDTDVLRARVGGALDVPHPRTDLAAAHDAVAARLTAQERHLHARYLRRQASLIRVADKALDAIAPRVDQASAAAR